MYFDDKKIAAKKTENIFLFQKQLEECSICFKDKEQQLAQKRTPYFQQEDNKRMKPILHIIVFVVASMQWANCQQPLQTKAEIFTAELIDLIEKKDEKKLAQHFTKNIYCGICTESADDSNQIRKKLFLKKYLYKIFDRELLQRLQRKETRFFANSTDYGDCVILYTTTRKNEYGDGHEGAQFGFWLTEENGKLKLSGLEMIP